VDGVEEDELVVFKFVFKLVGKLIVVVICLLTMVLLVVIAIVFVCSLSSSLLDEFDKASSLPRLLLALVII